MLPAVGLTIDITPNCRPEKAPEGLPLRAMFTPPQSVYLVSSTGEISVYRKGRGMVTE